MKKIVVLLLLFIACFGIYLGLSKEQVTSTFNDYETSYSIYELSFPNKNISTNNFEKYFKNYKIIEIKPYINKLYSNILSNYKSYQFSDISVNSNINRFKNNYVALLEKKGYRTEALKYKLDGIVIEKAIIYCSDKDIEEIITKIENIQVKKRD